MVYTCISLSPSFRSSIIFSDPFVGLGWLAVDGPKTGQAH